MTELIWWVVAGLIMWGLLLYETKRLAETVLDGVSRLFEAHTEHYFNLLAAAKGKPIKTITSWQRYYQPPGGNN